MTVWFYVIGVIAAVIGFGIGYFIRRHIIEAKIASSEKMAEKIIRDAEKEAEAKKREMLLEAKEEAHQMRKEFEKEHKEQRAELQKLEKRILQKEEALDRKTENIENKEASLHHKEQELEKLKNELNEIHKKQISELERLSGLTTEEARKLLLTNIEEEIKHEKALKIKEMEAQVKDEAKKKAQEIITLAIQRCAADHVAESTVSVVDLPNDEMKGRIIGREGRNISTLETLTGVDLIIDDTPEAVILSSFDPIRREVAHIALQKLIADGRIHPARIEEMVEKAQKEVEQTMREEGEKAIFETGLHGIHPELVKLLGKLKYRTSYGQNVLQHSIEVAHLAANLAGELGVDSILAKRAGLLHDVGKAVDQEEEGSHVPLGVKLAKKYQESPEVIHAIAAHHGDIDPETIEAALVQAADTISAARPGARRQTLEAYIKRLTKLEEIADSFDGVEKAYAIQAGREIRIMVKPDRIDDAEGVLLARDIVKKIEEELKYPGQIKVVVIRETRSVDYAK